MLLKTRLHITKKVYGHTYGCVKQIRTTRISRDRYLQRNRGSPVAILNVAAALTADSDLAIATHRTNGLHVASLCPNQLRNQVKLLVVLVKIEVNPVTTGATRGGVPNMRAGQSWGRNDSAHGETQVHTQGPNSLNEQ